MAEDKAALLARINQAFGQGVPQNAALGLEILDFAPGEAVARLPYDPKLVGNPTTGVLHGGAITTLIDGTCGIAVFLKLEKRTRIATLDLRIDYLKPATPGRDVIAKATCYKLTTHVAFVRAIAYHDDPTDAIASAAGTFVIFGESGKPQPASEGA